MRKESWVASTVDIPKGFVKINTIPRIKGTQLPMYPHAKPWEETISIFSSVVTSVSMES